VPLACALLGESELVLSELMHIRPKLATLVPAAAAPLDASLAAFGGASIT
jgi:hypothetical protein